MSGPWTVDVRSAELSASCDRQDRLAWALAAVLWAVLTGTVSVLVWAVWVAI